jgi:hypothetical protein
MGKYASNQETLDDIRNVIEMLGRIPLVKDYEIYGKYSPAHVQHRFGSFGKALELVTTRLRWYDLDIPIRN